MAQIFPGRPWALFKIPPLLLPSVIKSCYFQILFLILFSLSGLEMEGAEFSLMRPTGPAIRIGLHDTIGGGESFIDLTHDYQNIGFSTLHDAKSDKVVRVRHVYTVLFYDSSHVRVEAELHIVGAARSNDFVSKFDIFNEKPTILAPFAGIVLKAAVIRPAR